ncbi:GlpM family protein [Undibacterium sp. LFS511W]|uniref:GlpM family protein n=2 Tax=Undibacterium luofuense TaxID=2828733 RepID=A0A941I3L9_9BURK|nr:GlpM family protein [Undibacterium luofuense]
MFSLFLKSLLGAAAVLLISLVARTRYVYLAGLVPLFPTFALIAHVLVATERGPSALRETALFGLVSLLPYGLYLLTVFLMAEKARLPWVLGTATLVWVSAAGLLLWVWAAVRGTA